MPRIAWILLSAVLGQPVFFSCLSWGACSQGAQRTTIFYINGITTTEAAAESQIYDSLRPKLLTGIQGTPIQPDCLDFKVAYNHTKFTGTQISRLADLYESAKQLATETKSKFLRWLGGVEPLPDQLQQLFVDKAYTVDALATVDRDDLNTHLEQYVEVLEAVSKPDTGF